MKMEEITTEKEFIAYMKPYGTHVDHLMQEEEATATECVELIKKECVCIQRKKKLQKIKNG